MSDQRAANVQRFREEQGAERVWVLSAVIPFSVSQDRVVVVERPDGAQLVTCHGCTPRTALGQGTLRPIASDVLAAFVSGMNDADMAWTGDDVPPNVHDGVTFTVEHADASGYERVRIVDPQTNSPHDRLLVAWADAFPEARKLLD
jgi:hypothetical protein